MSERDIHNLTMTAEDARTSIRKQYGVRLTYTDGRETIHIRENQMSAENQVEIHRRLMVQEPSWKVVSAELVVRTVRIELGPWDTARIGDEEGGMA